MSCCYLRCGAAHGDHSGASLSTSEKVEEEQELLVSVRRTDVSQGLKTDFNFNDSSREKGKQAWKIILI